MGIVLVLLVASAILFARIIMGQDDSSQLWLPVMTTVTMMVVAAPTGWSIGSALQRQGGEDK